jgi:hypothetical protein
MPRWDVYSKRALALALGCARRNMGYAASEAVCGVLASERHGVVM